MFRLISFTCALLLLPTAALAHPVTIESCDRQVTFDAPPTRAVSNDVNLTEMMLALGLQDRMVGYTGITGWNKITPELREDLAELPQLSERYPALEVLLEADIDLFFAGWNYGMRVGGDVTPASLGEFGIPVYELTESCIHIMDRPGVSIADMYNDLRNLGRIFGVDERAQALVDGYQARLDEITARTTVAADRPVRVFVYDSGEDTPLTAGRYAMPTAMIEAAGGTNIMDDVESSWTRVGWEPVVERAPDVVVIVNYGEVTAEQKIEFMRSNAAFSSIPAVANDRFVVLEYVEATPGPRNIDAIDRLARAFHPALFD